MKRALPDKSLEESELYMCNGCDTQEKHYVPFVDMVKSAVGKNGLSSLCKKCSRHRQRIQRKRAKLKGSPEMDHTAMYPCRGYDTQEKHYVTWNNIGKDKGHYLCRGWRKREWHVVTSKDLMIQMKNGTPLICKACSRLARHAGVK